MWRLEFIVNGATLYLLVLLGSTTRRNCSEPDDKWHQEEVLGAG